MLHVFHVDGGRTLHLDVGLVTGAVSGLQAALADVALVPTPNQVLLISGGTVLEPSKPLSGYAGAGTESNPIYLTSRVVNLEPGALPFHGDEAAEVASTHKDLIAQVESIGGPANFESVKRCSGVAKSCAQNAERAYEVCKKLVEDQHLLHQGWNTLVANLEDVVRSCERKMRKLSMTLEKFLATKDQAAQLLTVFAQDLEVLAKIPLPPALLSEDVRSQLSLAASTAGGGVTPTTLLEWINLADSRHSLEDLEKEAKAQLDQMSRLEMSGLEAQWEQAKTAASQEDMVAIKGIGKRLGQLDEYLRKAETVVAEQRKWAEVVAAMESKALPKPDPALLADIRQTQEESLKGLLGQQSQLVEIAIKFRDSKAELLDNVRRRIGTWIQETHGQLYELATRQMRHTAKLGHLRRRLELLRQIHESPPLFASSVAEVLRRRSFSTEFLGWANALATKALELRNHEEEMRAGFGRKLQRHFLKSLFPALANADTVPEFATLAPQPFDLGLPPLQADDLHHLRASATSLKPFLLVSRASVYEKLSVDNPFQQQSGLRREPSFLGTPPKMIYSGKSFPSTTWLSGEENLDLSPSALLAASTVTPPTRPEFASLASSLPKSPLTADAPPKRPHSTSPNPSEDGGKRSAPIRIPSRPSSMNTSRQASESQFATPDQDFHPASSGDMGSLPEMISKAELIGSLAKDLGKVESPHVMRPVSLSASTPSPMTQRKGAGLDEEDPLAGTGDLLLQASTGTAQTQTSTEFTHPSVLSEKEETIAKLAREEKILNRRITDLESAVMSQSHFVVQKKSVLETELSLVRAEATELKREMLGLEAVQKEGVTKIRDVLASVSVLDTTLKRKASNAQETAMLIQRNQLQTRLNENEREVGEAKSARESAEAQAKEAQSRIENKDLEIASLKAALADQEIATHRLVEDAQAEITKHLVIENELAMEELRKALKTELNERDAEICRLHEELGTKEEELNKERREKEDLLISVCERSDSVSPSIESRLRHELEGEYRDKLGMLIRGEETKRSKALERAEAEKRAELRLLSEKKDADLAALTASLTALQAQLNHATANRSRHDSLTDTKEGDATLLAAEKAEEPMGPMGLSMSGSVMTLVSPSPDDNADTSAKSPVSQGGEGGGVCREVQTRVSGRSDVVVRVAGEVWEGDGVLVTWSDEFKGFILLTTGSTAYFVKETSARRLDLIGPEGGPTSKCALARVKSKPDYCQIRKLHNRYNLPLDTKFYRVDLDKLPLPSRFPHSLLTTSPAQSKARVKSKPDYCQIRKLHNRYNLPLDTKFYRVDLDKLPLPSRFPHSLLTTSPAQSKARVKSKPDYCQIRKLHNRYNLPLDTKFYRVDLDKLPLPSRFPHSLLTISPAQSKARVKSKPDYCQIRKLHNRYNLPLDTKFYRVDLDKLPLPSRFPHSLLTTSPAQSKARVKSKPDYCQIRKLHNRYNLPLDTKFYRVDLDKLPLPSRFPHSLLTISLAQSKARVKSKPDYCQIRKLHNRYNLPLDTKFYRVDLEKLPLPSRFPHSLLTTSPAQSKARVKSKPDYCQICKLHNRYNLPLDTKFYRVDLDKLPLPSRFPHSLLTISPAQSKARVKSKPDYCQIRKLHNRYNLPLDTKFYRVDLDKLPLPSRFPHSLLTTSPAQSKARVKSKPDYCQIRKLHNRYNLPLDTKFYRVDLDKLPLPSRFPHSLLTISPAQSKARVKSKPDYCQIRKLHNRYNLPLDTKFYRVDLDKLPLPSRFPHSLLTISPAQSKARVKSKPDYCQIRKLHNRYNLPLDTKFYRVDLDKLPLPSRFPHSLLTISPAQWKAK